MSSASGGAADEERWRVIESPEIGRDEMGKRAILMRGTTVGFGCCLFVLSILGLGWISIPFMGFDSVRDSVLFDCFFEYKSRKISLTLRFILLAKQAMEAKALDPWSALSCGDGGSWRKALDRGHHTASGDG